MNNRFVEIAGRLNTSPVWNHTMLCLFAYFWEMVVLFVVEIIRYLKVGYSEGLLNTWLIMTIPLIIFWLALGVRNYYINKKIGIWKYYQSKTRNGKLID